MAESPLFNGVPTRRNSRDFSGTSTVSDLPEVAALKRRRKRILWTLVLLLFVTGVSAKPGFAAVKRWRCVKLAEDSAELLSQQKVEQAFIRARAAHQLIPEEPQALRAVARVLAARNDWANAAAFWSEVVKREPSFTDRREYAEAALRTGALLKAIEQVDVLMRQDAGTAENHLVGAKVYFAQKDLRQAVNAARTATKLDPAHEVAESLLGQLLLQNRATRDEGVQRLWKLGEGKSVTALQALLALSVDPEIAKEDMERLAGALRAHPLTEETHRLKALELDLRGAPEKRVDLLDAAQEKYAAAEPKRLRLFASWLSLQGEHARTLQVLPLEQARTRKDLFLVRLDAMAALNQWREVLECLQRDRVPLEQPLVHLFQARCWRELEETERADVEWRSALTSAASDPSILLYIAGYAEKAGVRDQAECAYRVLTQNPKTARFAYEALLRLTQQSDTLRLRDLLAEMTLRWPKDTALTNDLAYVNTLLNIDVPRNLATAKQLVETAPESLPHRTVLALAELRGGNTEAALQAYAGLNINWKAAAPGAVVVYASALRQIGREEEARAMVAALTADALRPEEQVLFAAIQNP